MCPINTPVYKYVLFLVTHSCPTICNPMDYSQLASSNHGDSPGKNTQVGCQALLQRIFPTQELNWGLLHCRLILYQLSYQGSPYISMLLLLLLLSHFSRVQLCATPSLGFSRQEHWSGLPFPSPMHESEK